MVFVKLVATANCSDWIGVGVEVFVSGGTRSSRHVLQNERLQVILVGILCVRHSYSCWEGSRRPLFVDGEKSCSAAICLGSCEELIS